MLVSIFQRNRINRMCVHSERRNCSCDYRGWHVQVCSAGLQSDHPGELMLLFQSGGSLPKNFLFLGEAGLFTLCRPSSDWMRPIYIREGKLLTQKAACWFNLFQSLFELTHKIDQHMLNNFYVSDSSRCFVILFNFHRNPMKYVSCFICEKTEAYMA